MSTIRIYKLQDKIFIEGQNVIVDEVFNHLDLEDKVIVAGIKQRERKGFRSYIDSKPVSILEGIKIESWRRCGNTTRLIDNAIQLLFKGHRIIVEDHYNIEKPEKEQTNFATDDLVRRIRYRLEFEHKLRYQLDYYWDNEKNEMWLSTKRPIKRID